MLWALLAAFLRRRPLWVQAGMVGLCTGLFVVATVNAGQRDLAPGPAAALVLAVALPIGWAFSRALHAESESRATDGPVTYRVHAAYAAVWLIAVATAVATIFGDGGVRVAVIAIVPIVLLAPPAVIGIRAPLARRRKHDPAVPPATG